MPSIFSGCGFVFAIVLFLVTQAMLAMAESFQSKLGGSVQEGSLPDDFQGILIATGIHLIVHPLCVYCSRKYLDK